MNEKVLKEVRKAYADCHMDDFHRASKIRELMFKASEPVSIKDAVSILKDANVNYNAFTPEFVDTLPEGAMVTIAREYSVCLYVSGVKIDQKLADEMNADEFSKEKDGVYRLWWD